MTIQSITKSHITIFIRGASITSPRAHLERQLSVQFYDDPRAAQEQLLDAVGERGLCYV